MATVVNTPAELDAVRNTLGVDYEKGANTDLDGYGSPFQRFSVDNAAGLSAGDTITANNVSQGWTSSGVIWSISTLAIVVKLNLFNGIPLSFEPSQIIETGAIIDFDTAPYDGSVVTSWIPIGMTATGASNFTGSLDGKGYAITGMKIDMTGRDGVALCSRVVGCVKNLSVTGEIVCRSGTSAGMISGYVGASVGGGIQRCACHGSITAADWSQSGGVCAAIAVANDCIDCYSTVVIDGDAAVGGIYGRKFGSGTAVRCHAVGALTGNSYVGGIGGQSSAGSETNCFWNTQTTGVATSTGGATGLTSAQMKDVSNFDGWDFADVWYMGADYPELTAFGSPFVWRARYTGTSMSERLRNRYN